ncbi:MAG: hypothetical protein KAY65_00815 [Planctomycetes bacterium]|nr:hypothetical protein [Planctomycetota bacterium]
MRRTIITVAAVVVVVGATEGWAGLVPVNAASVTRDGIEYYIETDKCVYDLEEDVEILYRVTNLTDEDWRVSGAGTMMDIVVAAKEGDNWREVWWWHWYKGGSAGPSVLELQPNESVEISDIWPQIDYKWTPEIEDDTKVSLGVYRISGVFPRIINSYVALDIAIIPEPSSMALFLTGTFLLIRFA